MTIQSIREKLSCLEIYERRRQDYNYEEVVVYSRHASDVIQMLAKLLGPAVKISGQSPSNDAKRLTRNFGGIYEDQTLFKKDVDGGMLLAMLWPWGDREHTTLKIAAVRAN